MFGPRQHFFTPPPPAEQERQRRAIRDDLMRTRARAPLAHTPGDFTTANRDLLENHAMASHAAITAWEIDAAETLNPERQAEALAIAELSRDYYQRVSAFYRRWKIDL